MAATGCDLVLGARRFKKLEALADELRGAGVKVLPLEVDLTSVEQIEAFTRAAQAEFTARRYDSAMEHVTAVLEGDPRNVEALPQRAHSLQPLGLALRDQPVGADVGHQAQLAANRPPD